MNGRRLLSSLLLPVFGLMMLAAGVAQAQVAPIKLYLAKVEVTGSVRLAWTRPANVTIDKYLIYRAEGPDTSKAILLDETKDTTKTDVLPMTFVAVPSYTYFIVGKTSTGTLLKSNVVTLLNVGIPPIGSFKLDAKVDAVNAIVQLSWTKPPVDSVIKYYVYRYGGPLSAIQLIDSTTGLSLTDKLTLTGGSGGMMGPDRGIDQTKYMFTYYVKAKTPAGTLQSTSAVVYFTVTVKKDTVSFVTTPVTTAQKDSLYIAKVLAKSSDPTAKITYVLDRRPDGMTLDVSGTVPVIKWTPRLKGFYNVVVLAISDKLGQARQEYTISVAGGNGIVQGTVTDTTGAKLAKVIIQIMKRDPSPMSNFNYSTVTDANGFYRFTKLDPGSYILQAIPTSGGYKGQWWNGKDNADQADRLTVSDSSVVPFALANFTLRGRAVVNPTITVSGTVTDTVGLPVNVRESRVMFVRSDFALNSSTPSPDAMMDNFKKFFDYDKATDFRMEGSSNYTFKAAVDSFGHYSLKLPQGSYIAYARAPGYASEFYKEQTDLLSANIMKLAADSANINFTLAPLPPVVLGEMSGSVLDTAKNIGVRARVIAFRDGWTMADGYKVAKNYFTDTDSLGKFKFTELLPGNYMVMAVPMGGYAPAYYTTADTASINWKRSTKVVINGNSVSGIDIIVKQLSATKGGFTWIAGTVKGRMNGTLGGVAGAIVTATDASGQPAGYGITDADGNYTILGVAPDNYTVSVDKAGYTSTSTAMASPSYSTSMMAGTSNTVGVIVPSFTLDAITSVNTTTVSAVPTEFTVEQNYPNPFNPSTKIQFSLPAAQHVTVSVYDLLGREVAALVNGQMTAGTHEVEWNAAAMPTGIYFYRVNVGASSVVKKMMLLK